MAQPPRGGTGAGDRPVSTGGYVVLGLLLDAPASGWDLVQAAGRSISHFWPLTKAHIYTELAKLADRGYCTSVEVRQDGYPDKRVYTVTEEGRAAFEQWLDSVELVQEHGRNPLQLQMFFAAHATTERLQRLLNTWDATARAAELLCSEILERKGIAPESLPRVVLESESAPAGGDSSRDPHRLDPRGLTALFGLRRAQADQIWLSEARRLLASSEQE